jgi:glycogen debranching enzyme
MGESERAGTKGLPGTSRDGAPVEITGLLKSALTWAANLHEQGILKPSGVEANGMFIPLSDNLLLIEGGSGGSEEVGNVCRMGRGG